MLQMPIRSFTAVFVLFFVTSCNYRVDKNSGVPSLDPQNKASGTIDFKMIKEQILTSRCIGCHSQYNSYSSVKFELNSILEQVSIDRMSKSGPPLSADLKALLTSWSGAGAPETLQAKPPGEPQRPIELQPNYPSISLMILGPKYIACHNPQGQAKFLDLSSRFAIFSQRNKIFGAGAGQKLLDFDKPEESYLLNVIKDPAEPMPPTWSGLPRLTDHETQTIQDWIGLGLP
jgi:hypothetical protein